MAGLDPATQPSCVRATERHSLLKDFIGFWMEYPARTDVRALGGRVEPGHDEFFCVWYLALSDSHGSHGRASPYVTVRSLNRTAVGVSVDDPAPNRASLFGRRCSGVQSVGSQGWPHGICRNRNFVE
jgi:hypothetical protein